MTGGGKQNGSASDNSWKYTLGTVRRKIKKQKIFEISFFRKLVERISLHVATSGSILIEFAVCMPVLIILLFYIHDLPKLKRYYDQTEFVAQQMVNILQNLSKQRLKENKTLNFDDLRYAASLAFQTIYPGTTQYSPDGLWHHALRHIPYAGVYYVQGTSNGKAKCLWGKSFRSGTAKNPPWTSYYQASDGFEKYVMNYSSNEIEASSIYPTLKVEDGKSKIILETFIYWDTGTRDLTGTKILTAREAFGCCLANVSSATAKKNFPYLFFPSVVIFTPNAGFPETGP